MRGGPATAAVSRRLQRPAELIGGDENTRVSCKKDIDAHKLSHDLLPSLRRNVFFSSTTHPHAHTHPTHLAKSLVPALNDPSFCFLSPWPSGRSLPRNTNGGTLQMTDGLSPRPGRVRTRVGWGVPGCSMQVP